MPIRVRLNKVLGGLFIAVSLLNGFVFLMTHQVMQLVIGSVMGLVGVLYIMGEVLAVTANEVQIKNPFGMVLRRHPIRSLADLEMDGNKLFVVTGGERKKIASLGFIATGTDVDALRAAIHDARGK
jgi:hypothetical protein